MSVGQSKILTGKELSSRVMQLIKEYSGVPEIKLNHNFYADLGMDSLDVPDFLLYMETNLSEFGRFSLIEPEDTILETVRGLVTYVRRYATDEGIIPRKPKH